MITKGMITLKEIDVPEIKKPFLARLNVKQLHL